MSQAPTTYLRRLGTWDAAMIVIGGDGTGQQPQAADEDDAHAVLLPW
jgi:hypothetical protein